jgi:putative ABC transport system substrate-binding protein
MGVHVQSLDVRSPEDIDSAFERATSAHADGLVVAQAAPITTHLKQVVELAAKHRLPAIYNTDTEWIPLGGLMSYGPSVPDLHRRAAVYVDKILKGTKPADLPVERPIRFELVINLNAAKQIGLTIPPDVLARADRVIK